MARTTTEEATCDVCGAPATLEPYTVTHKGRTAIIDLCPLHGDTLEPVFAAGQSEPRRHPRKPDASGHAVIPIEDL